jgi:hypothetical protein
MAGVARTEKLSCATAEANIPMLTGLLHDAVDSGASVGFLPPLGVVEAQEYWREVIASMGR